MRKVSLRPIRGCAMEEFAKHRPRRIKVGYLWGIDGSFQGSSFVKASPIAPTPKERRVDPLRRATSD